jgi:hypothetical protein
MKVDHHVELLHKFGVMLLVAAHQTQAQRAGSDQFGLDPALVLIELGVK